MKRKPWTKAEDRTLRRHAGRESCAAIAKRLPGRTPAAVKSRATVLKVSIATVIKHQPWSAEELAILRRDYKRVPVEQLAKRLGRTVNRIYAAAKRFGISDAQKIVIAPDFDRFLRKHHAKGWSDAEIAAAWSRAHPQRTINRRTLGDRRNQLGLSHNALSKHRRRKVSEKTREQCRAAGVKSLAEVRSQAYAKFAALRGWPDDLAPRQVQMLDAIYERGPQTRRQLAEVVGCAWKHQRNWLCATRTGGKRYAGGTYLTDLMHRGLVVRLPGRIVKSGPRKGQHCYLYAIPVHIRRKVTCKAPSRKTDAAAAPTGAGSI